MSIFNKIIDFFKNLFKKDKTKMIEAPQQNVEISQNNIQHNETIYNNQNNVQSTNSQTGFINSLKVDVKDIHTEEKGTIETPICDGDGLGIKNDVSY